MAPPKDDKTYNVGRSEAVLKAYRDRLKILKKAQEYAGMDEIPRAVQHYSQYLNILAQYFDVSESSLSPALFNREKDLAEMLLISHVYWDLAKAYDRSPTLTLESIRCLKQFVNFTLGFKYQYANSQMVKKFVRQRLAHNPKAFKETYDRIRVEAKGCYIATYCYGEQHPITSSLRNYRNEVLFASPQGRTFVRFYQFISPKLIWSSSRLPFLEQPTTAVLQFLIKVFMWLTKVRISDDTQKPHSH